MGEKVFIARQDTLEDVQAKAGNIHTNTDGEILPALWIAEYKLHGEKSYVFRDADIWERMCKSTAAVNDTQINGEALEFVLTHPEKASLSDWLMRLSDTRADGQALFAGIETAAQLAGNAAAMAAIVQSETAMTALSASETAMTALGGAGTAMNAICSNEMALEKAMQSPHYGEAMRGEDMAIAKIALALAGQAGYAAAGGMAAITGNEEALSAVLDSKSVMDALCASETGIGAVLNSETAFTALSASETGRQAVADSKTALKLIVNNDTLVEAVEASEDWYGSLSTSKVKKHYSTSYESYGDYDIFHGVGYAVNQWSGTANKSATTKLDGVSYSCFTTDPTKIGKFFKSSLLFNAYPKYSYVHYIPIGEAIEG